MTRRDSSELQGHDAMLMAERRRLVGLCAHLTGDFEAAEDLAQETLLIAWRQEQTLHDPQLRQSWLTGIARNVCRTWARGRSRDAIRRIRPNPNQERGPDSLTEGLVDSFDLELELERNELALLKDRALAQLPAQTRNVLIGRCIDDLPQVEVADRLCLSPGAVAMRLQRGKLALRALLATDFRTEAEAYGIIPPASEEWRQTRIWCPICGSRRLEAYVDRPDATVAFRCPGCCQEDGDTMVCGRMSDGVQRLTSYKSILARQLSWFHIATRRILEEPAPCCASCGNRLEVRRYRREETIAPWGGHGLHICCHACRTTMHATLLGLVLDLPQVQQFWRQHPRLRTLPEREVEVDGRPALLITLESLGGSVQLDVLSASDTYEVLHIHQLRH